VSVCVCLWLNPYIILKLKPQGLFCSFELGYGASVHSNDFTGNKIGHT